MSMNSKGPGSTRRAFTSRAAGSRVRSDTQLQTRPDSSGCILSRNRNQVSVCARISTSAYSVNRSGHEGRSLVIAQTWSIGASMWIELSVCPAVCVPGSRVLLIGKLLGMSMGCDGVRPRPEARREPASGEEDGVFLRGVRRTGGPPAGARRELASGGGQGGPFSGHPRRPLGGVDRLDDLAQRVAVPAVVGHLGAVAGL